MQWEFCTDIQPQYEWFRCPITGIRLFHIIWVVQIANYKIDFSVVNTSCASTIILYFAYLIDQRAGVHNKTIVY